MGTYHNGLPAGGGGLAAAVQPVSGTYISNRLNASALSTMTPAADRLECAPFTVARAITLQEIAAEVATGVGSTNFRIGIYSDVNGVPGTLLAGGVTSHDAGTSSTVRTEAISIALSPGNYWLGLHTSAGTTMRAVPLAAAATFGDATGSNPSAMTVKRATGQTYASGMPATAPAMTDTAGALPPWFRLRIA